MTSLEDVETVIFDLDGTLVDTAPDLSMALNHVLTGIGRGPVAVKDVRHMVGFGARAMIFKGLDLTGGRLAMDEIDALHGRFLDHYSENIAALSRPYPVAEAVLALLRDQGKRLGICTNKPNALARQLLAELDLEKWFGAVVGGDEVARPKPDPGHLLATIEALGGAPANSLFIGDSEVDLMAGEALGVPVILLGHGYSKTPVESFTSADTYSDFHELLERLTKVS